MLKRFVHVALVANFVGLGGCGTYVPDIQEFWGTSDDADAKVRMVSAQIQCELRRAARLLIKKDIVDSEGAGHPRALKWLDTWGADVAMIFTIEEKSSLNPGVSINDPLPSAVKTFAGQGSTTTPQSYSTGLGANLSSDGYRQDKVHVFYPISSLVGPINKLNSVEVIAAVSCTQQTPNASLIIQSDLKLYEWLRIATNLQDNKQANFTIPDPLSKDGAISHEVKFDIVSSGNVTPTWKLLRVSANTGASPLFSASRDRTQDLIVTLGPLSAAGGLKQTAQNAANTSEFSATVSGVFRGLNGF